MTRDEALTEWVVPAIRRTWNEKKCAEILKALEQEPCTVTEFADRCMECGKILGDMIKSCNDCVSREEAIKPFLVDSTEEWTSADIVKYLKSLLSVMPTWRYPQVPGITPIVVPVEEEQGDIQYDNKTTLNKV